MIMTPLTIQQLEIIWGISADPQNLGKFLMLLNLKFSTNTCPVTSQLVHGRLTEENRASLADDIRHLVDHVDNLHTFASNPEFAGAPVQISDEVGEGNPLWICSEFLTGKTTTQFLYLVNVKLLG